MSDKLTSEKAHELFRYDAESGNLYWKVARSFNVKPGARAGCLQYYKQKWPALTVRTGGHLYLVHRVVWLMKYGKWPEHEIDHIDGNRINNRIKNLRDVPHSINQKNVKKRVDNKSGFTGVAWCSIKKRWRSRAHDNGKEIHVGYFKTAEEAIKQRESVVKGIKGYTKRHGVAV